MHKEDLLQFDAAMVITGADGTGETHQLAEPEIESLK
jgi:hypothetical protein